jgi:DNA-binding transcriptional LysR family regulator
MQKPLLEIRHFNSIVVLAEELNYSNAAIRLGISQTGLTRRIQDAEKRLGRRLFNRNRSTVELTDAGRTCVPEARLAIEHEERAVQFTKAHSQTVESHLVVGRSPYADPLLVDVLLSLDLPLHPHLDIQWRSQFAPELVHDVLTSHLDLALITHPDLNPRLSTVKLTEAPLYILLPEDHPMGKKENLKLKDLTDTRWIVFDRRVHPTLYENLMERANLDRVEIKGLDHVMSAEELSYLVSKSGGAAFLTKTGALRVARHGLIAKPLVEENLCLDVHLAARADNRSKLVSEFFRSFVTKLKSVLEPSQMSLPIESPNGLRGR